MSCACTRIWNEGKVMAFYKGLGPTLTLVAPTVAINFTVYNWLKGKIIDH